MALGLGANLGDPPRTLHAAVVQLSRWLLPRLVSPLYRSHPVSSIPQPDYYNLVVLGSTHFAAEDLLAMIKALERSAGRRPGERDSPRLLDVDLLLYGDLVIDRPELTLPHPRLRLRRFALGPLVDLAPDLRLPDDGARAADVLDGLETQGVVRVPWPPGLKPTG
ncbi:MAG: 2-amino-4-hydroxy-6-hydroxymethyldihydropteridine diphosphokinase [Acidobacteria bacterium]|nr:2-amino-4-hydroxy-6-hydroxymethyldihydropteridine diphosphokinase [Acidobacteriota bacterium]